MAIRSGRLRVVTWNVWWRFGERWRERQPAVVETLRDLDADVVALQEVWGTASTTQADELARALGLHAAFAEPSYPLVADAPRPDEHADVALGIGLLSRWPVRTVRPLPLPARPGTEAPVALLVSVAHPDGPLHVVVACLEYDPGHDEDRVAQARFLAGLATDPALDGPLPVVVAGDLNAAVDDPVLEPLAAVLTDAWTAGGGGHGAVTAPEESGEAQLGKRIDHVLLRPGRAGQVVDVRSAVLAGDPVDGVTPSDHRAVVCDVSWSAPP
ncbi:endonuclease [Geodermatophilus sabuli]|uniref:Endonuclease n=1 Tax=Geodermatophilus sabuli TaxID=1564158 RepID=A0A7K3W2N7_9ACTN|nr:endonuclease/exonuclease/phosphatase family protein [Geodermatophilus sabuli]NEK59149.1 endonuclease [Geodermatophilus sabuli]